MSRSLLIFLVLAVGILTGWLFNSYISHHTGTEDMESPEKPLDKI